MGSFNEKMESYRFSTDSLGKPDSPEIYATEDGGWFGILNKERRAVVGFYGDEDGGMLVVRSNGKGKAGAVIGVNEGWWCVENAKQQR